VEGHSGRETNMNQANEMVGPYRVMDMTKTLIPDVEKRRLKIRRFYKEDTLDYHSDMDITSHLGTHIESPYHYRDDWKDIMDLPVTSYIGRGVLLDLAHIEPKAPISCKDLDQSDKGKVKQGDVVILKSPFHCEPFSNDPNDQRPYLCKKSGEWFVAKKVKCVGFGDSVAIEHTVKDSCDIHELVMRYDITFLEVLQNVEKIKDDIFMVIFLPIPVKGLDSCPVRAVVLEGVPGFC
jgi:kynurenine formamidase